MSAYVTYQARVFDRKGNSRFDFPVRAKADTPEVVADTLILAKRMNRMAHRVELTRSLTPKIGRPRRVKRTREL